MSNKIIKLGNATETVETLQSNEVYLDISKDSVLNINKKPSRDDSIYNIFVKLAQEHPNTKYPYDFVLSDPDLQYIRAFYGFDEEAFIEDYKIFLLKSKYQISKNTNVKAIQGSLENIFSWIQGERILLPEFGSKLRRLLYEGITQYNEEQIVAEIQHCISKWEPRVSIQKIVNVSSIKDTEDNIVHLEIIYTIPGLSSQQYSYDLYTNTSE